MELSSLSSTSAGKLLKGENAFVSRNSIQVSLSSSLPSRGQIFSPSSDLLSWRQRLVLTQAITKVPYHNHAIQLTLFSLKSLPSLYSIGLSVSEWHKFTGWLVSCLGGRGRRFVFPREELRACRPPARGSSSISWHHSHTG